MATADQPTDTEIGTHADDAGDQHIICVEAPDTDAFALAYFPDGLDDETATQVREELDAELGHHGGER